MTIILDQLISILQCLCVYYTLKFFHVALPLDFKEHVLCFFNLIQQIFTVYLLYARPEAWYSEKIQRDKIKLLT